MQYGILQLGTERLIARYVGPADHLAYNESVLRESLQSLEGQRLIGGEFDPVEKLEWSLDSGGQVGNLATPAGWIVEPGAPSTCPRMPQANAAAAAYPPRDVTVALRAAVWTAPNFEPQAAAVACSARRGSSGQASYSSTAEWLGVSYAIEGSFLRTSNSQVVQLEVISPVQKSAQARALLAAWIAKASSP
jgi:hypothetical protein